MASDFKKIAKILVVEDETILLDAMVSELEAEGFRVLRAEDGTQALEVTKKDKPDLILLDLRMPKMSGMDFLREIRKTVWGKNLPVIMSTNLEPEGEVLEGVADLKPTYFLSKSDTDLAEIIAKVNEILEV